MRWGTDVKTETPVDFVWGAGFEGRASRPIGRTAPGTGGGGGGGPAGVAPTADFTIAPPLSGADYVWGETVTINGGWTTAATPTAGLSNDTDGVIAAQDYKVVSTGVVTNLASASSHNPPATLGLGVANTPTGTEYIKLTVTDDDGQTGNKIIALAMAQADLVEPTSLSATTTFYTSSGASLLAAPTFSQIQPIFNVTGHPDEYGDPYYTV
jgi:hypothetical protein